MTDLPSPSHRKSNLWKFIIPAFLIGLFTILPCSAKPTPFRFTNQKISHSKDASPETIKSAKILRDKLSEMTGQEIEIEAGPSKGGIIVGTTRELPQYQIKVAPNKKKSESQAYLLRSSQSRLLVIGNSKIGLRNAVWDLLHELGYRQFFPGRTWEVIPRLTQPEIRINKSSAPDFVTRNIWYQFSTWPNNKTLFFDWREKNRVEPGFRVESGHSYHKIINANKALFKAHPEALSGNKLRFDHPQLRVAVRRYVDDFFEHNPELHGVSAEPSDAAGWDLKLGTPSNQAVRIANEIASYTEIRYPNKHIGLLAYNHHSAPPTITLNPKIIVLVATKYISSGADDINSLLRKWGQFATQVGVYDYYSNFVWARSLPWKSLTGDYLRTASNIKSYHHNGARYFQAESGDNWGVNGLSHYVSSRVLWNVNEDPHAIATDFFDKAFGDINSPMRDFYDNLSVGGVPYTPQERIGVLLDAIHRTKLATKDEGILRRLEDLVLYCHYIHLTLTYQNQKGAARQAAFTRLFEFLHDIRERCLVHSFAAVNIYGQIDKSVIIPNFANRKPSRDLQPFKLLEQDRELYPPPRKITAKKFGSDLAPIRFNFTSKVRAGAFHHTQGEQEFHCWLSQPDETLTLTIRGGIVYQDRGSVKVRLRSPSGASQIALVEADNNEHVVTFRAKEQGTHILTINDGASGCSVRWPAGQKVSVRSDLTRPMNHSTWWTAYFYVPRGTDKLQLFSDRGDGTIVGPNGVRYSLKGEPGYHDITIPNPQSDQFWKVEVGVGAVRLINVPPFFAREPNELLVPVEILPNPDYTSPY